MAGESPVVIITQNPRKAEEWARARGVRHWTWPMLVEVIPQDYRLHIILLPDWSRHPDSEAIADRFMRTLTKPAVSN